MVLKTCQVDLEPVGAESKSYAFPFLFVQNLHFSFVHFYELFFLNSNMDCDSSPQQGVVSLLPLAKLLRSQRLLPSD